MSLDEHIRALVDEIVTARLATLPQADAINSLPEVMTTQMVADALDRTPQHINTLARTGALRSKTDGKGRMYLREWVLEYVRSDRTAPAMERADRARLRNRNIPRTQPGADAATKQARR